MALEKQEISIDLTAGRDGGTDLKFVEGNLEVTNCVPDAVGRISKRRGFTTAFADVLATTGQTVNGSNEVVLLQESASTTVQVYDGTQWDPVPNGSLASLQISPVITQFGDTTGTARMNGDIAISGTSGSETLMVGLEEYNPYSKILIGGSPAISPVAVVSPSEFRSVTVNDRVILFYSSGSDARIEYAYLAEGRTDSVSGTSIGTETALISDKETDPRLWDVCVVGVYVVLIYVEDTNQRLVCNVYTESAGVLSQVGVQLEIDTLSVDLTSMVCVFPLTGGTQVGILWVDNSSLDIYGSVVTASTQAQPVTATLVLAGAAVGTEFSAASTVDGAFTIFTLTTAGVARVVTATATLTSIVAGTARTYSGVELASKAEAFSSTSAKTAYILLRSTTNKRYYLLDSSKEGTPIWQGFEYPDAVSTVNNLLPSLVRLSDGVFFVTIETRDDTSINFTTLQSIYKFDLANKQVPQCISAGSLVVAAPVIKVLGTGLNTVALERPVLGSATKSNGAGTLANGTYLYTAIWEHRDAEGRIYRSPTADFVEVITTGTDDTVSFTPVPPISFAGRCERAGFSTKARLILYRTLASGKNFFEVASSPVMLLGVTTMAAVTDVTPDSAITAEIEGDFPDLTAYPLVYTTGGVVDNVVPPAMLHITTHQNRVFGISQERNNEVWFSKPRVANVGLEFSDVLKFAISGEESLTAVASLDTTLVIFTRDSIWAISGDGPNNLAQGTFSAPQRVSAKIGCPDWRSIAETSEGVFFQSNQGFYFLSRGMQLTDIGNAMMDYDTAQVLAARVDYSRPWVYIVLGGQIFIFDYSTSQWYLWDLAVVPTGLHTDAPASANAKGSLWVQAENGLFKSNDTYQEPSDIAFPPSTVDFTMSITTQWIKPGGAAGYQRLYEVLILGEWKSSHTLQVEICYDYSSTVVETKSVALTTNPTGGYLLRVQPARQTCTSIKFIITETNPTGTRESFTLSGLRAIIGIKSKTPVPTARNV